MGDETLLAVVNRAFQGEYCLPVIQRSFVWKPAQVRNLCDSLFKEYPIGSLLMWDNPDYSEPLKGAPNQVIRPKWIIDGQQRITSLCLLLGKRPFWYGPEDWDKLREDYKVFINISLHTDTVTFKGRPAGGDYVHIEVHKVLTQDDAGKVSKLARDLIPDQKKDEFLVGKVIDRLVKLWNIRNSLIPVIEIQGKHPEEITEIFDRLNRGGTRVKETDIRLALIAAHNPAWRRQEFDPFLDELEAQGWIIPPGYLLQAMAICYQGKARVNEVDKTFWTERVTDVWKNFKEAVNDAIAKLWDHGIPTIELIPSEYTLIPLLAMHARFVKTQGYSFDTVFRWFLRANVEGRYNDAPLEQLTNDADKIYKSQNITQAVAGMPPDKPVDKNELISIFKDPFRRGGIASFLIYLLLWERDAHDWLQNLRLKATANKHGHLRPHWHHILPIAWAKKNGFLNSEWAANVTVLTQATNIRKIRAKPPWEYVPENKIDKGYLKEHLIPDKFVTKFCQGSPLSENEFQEFLELRASLLADCVEPHLSIP